MLASNWQAENRICVWYSPWINWVWWECDCTPFSRRLSIPDFLVAILGSIFATPRLKKRYRLHLWDSLISFWSLRLTDMSRSYQHTQTTGLDTPGKKHFPTVFFSRFGENDSSATLFQHDFLGRTNTQNNFFKVLHLCKYYYLSNIICKPCASRYQFLRRCCCAKSISVVAAAVAAWWSADYLTQSSYIGRVV